MMKSLLIKDFYVLKNQALVFAVIIVFYGVVTFFGGGADASMFSFLVVFLGIMLPITTIAYDERAKWDKYALSMPVSRMQIVLSKYLLCIILFAVAVVLNIVLSLIQKGSLTEMDLWLSAAIFSVGLLFVSVINPFLFRFGAEKGRLIIIAIALAPTMLFVILNRMGVICDISESQVILIFKILPVVALAAGVISVMVSLNIYQKKAF